MARGAPEHDYVYTSVVSLVNFKRVVNTGVSGKLLVAKHRIEQGRQDKKVRAQKVRFHTLKILFVFTAGMCSAVHLMVYSRGPPAGCDLGLLLL